MAAAPIDPKAFAEYVAQLQGTQTQRAFAADLNEVTKWGIDHTRLSRYVRGDLPVGRSVRARFETYAKARKLPLFDPATPEGSGDLAAALRDLTSELREAREDRAAVRLELEALRQERRAWEDGVRDVLRAAAAGQLPAALLDALAPRPPEVAQTEPA